MKLLNKLFMTILSGSILFSTFVSEAVFAEGELKTSIVNTESVQIQDQLEISSESIITNTNEKSSPTTTSSVDNAFAVFDIYDAHNKYLSSTTTTTQTTTTRTTTTTTTTTTTPVTSITKGIDVSVWQSSINWNNVKSDGIDFAIIRAGYGKFASQEDPNFDINMKNAKSAGIKCGAYWYSYATSVEEAYQEAEVCYSIIKDYSYEYPIVFDIEDPSQMNLSTAEVSAIIEAFCSRIQSKGYYVSLYSNANFLTTKVYSSVLEKYDIWVAHYGVSKPAFSGAYGMWQYSSTGSVNGINGDVDMNYSYIDYPNKISSGISKLTSSPNTNKNITVTTTVTIPSEITGIDVSFWQGDINWNNVKSDGIDYAVIRAGYGKYSTQIDNNFTKNITGAKAAGLDCGVYWYSYATSVEEAYQEAEACHSIIKNYKYEYPVVFDIEDTMLTSLSIAEISAITDAFCSAMQQKGYYVAIYSNVSFLNTKIYSSIRQKYDVWVSQHNVSSPSYNEKFGMWRFTNDAIVNGIQTEVNLSYAYVDYPQIIKSTHKNGY